MRRASLLIVPLSLLSTWPALANGRFPETNQLVVEPGNPDHAVVRATFGLLVTRDRGASWEFVCEDAFGPQNTDPPLTLLPGGVLVLGLDDGVSKSDPLGCNFELARGIEGPVLDVTASTGEPGTAFALTADDAASNVWISTDAAESFEAVARIADLSAVTLDAAPSSSDVLYLSGVENDDGVLYRSDDRGLSFERFTIPGASGSKVPYIAAVDPTDANTVYVRTYGIPGALLQTRDGGRTFSERALETRTPVQGFALSGDGSVVVASNPFDGTFRAARERFEFERVRCGGAACLAFADEDLIGCGSESLDGFVIGISRDRGETFSRLLAQSCIPGPVGCPEASGVEGACANTWPELRARLGAERCDPIDVQPEAGCFGSTGAGGTEAPPEIPTNAGGDQGGPVAATSESGSSAGCSCGTTGPSRHIESVWSVAVLSLVRRARQRSRVARS
jgi:photosystem II stability/assembly factor-like uncharacterized protein